MAPSTFFVAAFAAFAAVANAVPMVSKTVLHEKRVSIPRMWTRGEKVARDAILPVRIGLVQRNLEDGYEHLMDV